MLLAIAVVCVILLIGIFYMALRSTDTDVSSKEPYTAVLNQTFYTEREAILAKNLPAFTIKEVNFITEDTALFEGVEKMAVLPKGTRLLFSHAFHHKNGVSGVSQSVLVGKVWVNNKAFDIEYYWGNEHISFNSSDKGQWIFPPALWQKMREDTVQVFE